MVFRIIRTIIVVIASIGWIYPLFFSIGCIIVWCQVEASPVIYGTARTMNSFPFLHSSEQALKLAGNWCALSVLTWTIIIIRRQSSGKRLRG